MSEIEEKLAAKFQSGNQIPVTRTVLTLEEWEELQQLICDLRQVARYETDVAQAAIEEATEWRVMYRDTLFNGLER